SWGRTLGYESAPIDMRDHVTSRPRPQGPCATLGAFRGSSANPRPERNVPLIELADIQSAAERIRGRVHRTPLLSASTIGERAEVRLHLKCENFQKTGSFKPRGALNKVLSLSSEERAKGLITVSAGTHAQAVAWAA